MIPTGNDRTEGTRYIEQENKVHTKGMGYIWEKVHKIPNRVSIQRIPNMTQRYNMIRMKQIKCIPVA